MWTEFLKTCLDVLFCFYVQISGCVFKSSRLKKTYLTVRPFIIMETIPGILLYQVD